MEIRQLHAGEFEASLSLSEYAFKYKVTDEDRAEAKQKFKPEIQWGAFEGEVLGAQLTLLPLQVYIQGTAQPMGGIAGVSTWPESRRQGLVSKLLSHTLQTMNESGQSLSFLHPFLIPFYRRFGWEVYCEYKKYSIPVDKFPRKTEIRGSVKRDSAALEILERLYGHFAARYNGTLHRDREWWKSRVLDAETHHCVFYSEADEPEGYVLYKIIKNELVIDEFIYLNEEARKGLWTFLANHDSMITGALLKQVPSDDILPYLLPDPRISQENFPYFMARIVNASAFVENFTFQSRNTLESRTLFIEDEYAPWNDGLWHWSVTEEGAASLKRVEGDKAAADISCTIGTLTVLLLGYKRPRELALYGQLTAAEPEVDWLEGMIPQAKTALFDFF